MTDTPTMKQLVAIRARFDSFEAPIKAANRRIGDAGDRRNALAARIAELNAAHPPAPPAYDAAMVDLLASDPSAQVDADKMVKAIDDQAQYQTATAVLQANLRLVEHAMDKLDECVDAAEAEIKQHRADQAEVRKELIVAAHAYLADQFLTRFTKLRDEIMEPLLSFEEFFGRNQPGHEPIIPYTDPRLDIGTGTLTWVTHENRSHYSGEERVQLTERAVFPRRGFDMHSASGERRARALTFLESLSQGSS